MKIKGYRIEGQLGQGGMAIVYHAIQESLNRPVALKVMNPLFADNPQFTARFLEEGRLLASLHHNNIMTIYDIGVCDNLHYISMEYVDGGDLKQRIRSGLSGLTALDYTIIIGKCLQVAHAAKIVHRDVKPVNILFRSDDTLLLTDFGIAKQLVGRKNLTVTGSLVGSPYYLSPEQALGGDVDGRADIYSLGIVLFEMLLGKRPFDGDSQIDVALKHIEGHLPPLPARLSHFQPLLAGMTAKQVHDRFRDVTSMLTTAQQLRDSHQWGSDKHERLRSHSYPGFDDTTVFYVPELEADSPNHPTSDERTTAKNLSGVPSPSLRDARQPSDLSGESCSKKDAEIKTTVWGLRRTTSVAAGLCILALVTSLLTIGLPEQVITPSRVENQTTQPSSTDAPNKTNTNFAEMIEFKPHTLIEHAPLPNRLQHGGQPTKKTPVTERKHAVRTTQEEVGRLLHEAQIAFSEYRLTRPSGHSAYDYYQRVLRIEPANREASNGLTQVANRYLELAQKAVSKGQREKAERYTTTGLKIDRAHAGLLSFRAELIDRQSHNLHAGSTPAQRQQDESPSYQHETAHPETPSNGERKNFFQRLRLMMKQQHTEVEEDKFLEPVSTDEDSD